MRRDHMVSVRLTAEEYERCARLLDTGTAGTLSELARAAMKALALMHGPVDPLSERVSTLRSQVLSLSLQVDRVAGRVKAGGVGRRSRIWMGR